MSFHENRARKAKYAFEIQMSKDILSEGLLFNAVHEILKDTPESPETWFTTYGNSMGTVYMIIYVNDEDIYNRIKAAMATFKQETA